jgi:hypothetical protein
MSGTVVSDVSVREAGPSRQFASVRSASRVIHPAQRTRHGSLDSSLWQTVEQVQPEPWPEPIPVPEVADSDWGALDEAQGGDEPMWRVMA